MKKCYRIFYTVAWLSDVGQKYEIYDVYTPRLAKEEAEKWFERHIEMLEDAHNAEIVASRMIEA